MSFPEPLTLQAYNLQVVYEYALLLSLFVMLIVSWFLRMAVFNRITCATYLECPFLELFWGSFPIVLLVVMCGISTYALYVNDETYKSPALDVTVTGHQWYWSYKIMVGEGCDYMEWDSRLVLREEGSEIGFLDLLTVDRPLMVPINVLVRVFVTSEDVIHSWGAPGMGIKMDAIPGRLTRGLFELKLPGIIFGMCAELCGAMHSMMPTIVEGVPLAVYESWLG
nr:cytochrome c oxidase subunit 2 [Azumapecten farreri]ABQ96659.1 cytochrome c oxidase subunit 2 [Azumapecten farreri]ACL36021.1 cytochrome c oxidase subunit II [Azumapecten farreri]